MNNEENKKEVQDNAQEPEKQETEQVKRPISNIVSDPEEQIRQFGRGTYTLAVPIRAGGKDVETLSFDFTKITGREYVEALDSDVRSTNAFRVSATQAHTLFCIAAAKVTDGIDSIDIRDRMSAQDSVKAVQLATVFFTACNRAGNKRISNE